MKKIIIFALSVVLMLSTQLSVFASSEQTELTEPYVYKEQAVTVNYTEKAEEKVYHVTVSWLDGLNFTYTSNGKEWDSVNLKYKEEKSGLWTGGAKSITVQNRSNTNVQVDFEYESDYTGVSMEMKENLVGDGVTFESELNHAIISLPNAAEIEGVSEGTLPFAKFDCTLSGNLDTVIENNKDTLKLENGEAQLGKMLIVLN